MHSIELRYGKFLPITCRRQILRPIVRGIDDRKLHCSDRLARCHASSCVIGRFCLAIIGPTRQSAGRAADAASAAVQDVGVNRRRADILVASSSSPCECRSRRRCVANEWRNVWLVTRFVSLGVPRGLLDRLLHERLVNVLSTLLAAARADPALAWMPAPVELDVPSNPVDVGLFGLAVVTANPQNVNGVVVEARPRVVGRQAQGRTMLPRGAAHRRGPLRDEEREPLSI